MKKTIIGVVVQSLIALLILIPTMFLTNCWVSFPEKIKGQSSLCYQADKCLYYNQKNPDKSICADLLKKCGRMIVRKECKTDDDPNDCEKSIN